MHGDFIFGADFSTLEETERCGGTFSDFHGKGDAIGILASHGINCVRLRLWVNPCSADGKAYGGGTCDIASVIRLAKRARDYDMSVLLDIQYSDFWANSQRQLVPKEWKELDFPELARKVRLYTSLVIDEMKKSGVAPQYVQIGNEITGGFLFPHGRVEHRDGIDTEGYDKLAELLRAGIRGVREMCGASVILHLDGSCDNALWDEWLSEITNRSVGFDIIGASYFPQKHGKTEDLRKNLNYCSEKYGKDIIIVETSYPFTEKHFSQETPPGALVIGDSLADCGADGKPFPFSRAGQAEYVKTLLRLVRGLDGNRGKGLVYREPAWIPSGALWANAAAQPYIGGDGGDIANPYENECLFDFSGAALPALSEFLEASRMF